MAHIEEIMLHGKLTQVIVPDSSVQEIDDAVVKAFNAVNKAGDIMTGALTIKRGNAYIDLEDTLTGTVGRVINSANGTSLHTRNADGSIRRQFEVRSTELAADVKNSLILVDKTATETKNYTVLHTGNKPSGSYTGNGDATQRKIDTGGIGNVCLIYGGNGLAIVTPNGAFLADGDTGSGVATCGYSKLAFRNGVLDIQTTDARVNVSGGWYTYQVL